MSRKNKNWINVHKMQFVKLKKKKFKISRSVQINFVCICDKKRGIINDF